MKKSQSQNQDDVAALTAILREREDLLLKISGVTGCGVGLTRHGNGERVVIQIFVRSEEFESPVRQTAVELFGNHPVEIIVMTIPDAE